MIDEKYIFCYFLGNHQKNRSVAAEYAAAYGYKIAVIPMSDDGFRVYDLDFGDIRMTKATPGDFISLIKYAQCVFTDSFHAAVFSIIYQKQFFAMNRDKHKTMSSRLENLTDLFEMQNRFINNEKHLSFQYLNSIKPIVYKESYTIVCRNYFICDCVLSVYVVYRNEPF